MLKLENLSFSFKDKFLFENISLSLKPGEILNVLGPNGTGKTTFAKCILNIIKDYSGKVVFENRDFKEMSVKKRSEFLGYVGINSELPEGFTVPEYILLGAAPSLSFFQKPDISMENKVFEILNQTGCKKLKDKKISQLSQGEKQLVSLCRIIMQNPSVIIFDEPAAALDLKNQKLLLSCIKKLQKNGHIIINITHNPNHVFILKGKALFLMKDRHITGNADDIMTEENLSALYDTEIHIFENADHQKAVL